MRIVIIKRGVAQSVLLFEESQPKLTNSPKKTTIDQKIKITCDWIVFLHGIQTFFHP